MRTIAYVNVKNKKTFGEVFHFYSTLEQIERMIFPPNKIILNGLKAENPLFIVFFREM
jgi:hypothetical protein